MARWRTPVVPLLLLLLLTPSQQGDAAAASGIVNQVLPRMSAAPTVTVQAAVDKVRPTLGEEPPAAVPGSGDPRQVAAALSAARNEFEAVQVVVTGPATGVSAASVPLAGPGPDIPLRLSRAVSVSLEHASGPDGAAGEWFDALVPSQDEFYNESRNAFPFAVSAGERGLIWCEVFVPPQQPPGKYTGSVVVTWGGSGAHNTRAGSAAVAMALEVQPFTLPSVATLKSEFGFSFADITKGHGIKTARSYLICARNTLCSHWTIVYLWLASTTAICSTITTPSSTSPSAVHAHLWRRPLARSWWVRGSPTWRAPTGGEENGSRSADNPLPLN
jgi:hypothetical protein